MKAIEVTIQNLIGSGMDPKTENNPYLGFVYTSFQVRHGRGGASKGAASCAAAWQRPQLSRVDAGAAGGLSAGGSSVMCCTALTPSPCAAVRVRCRSARPRSLTAPLRATRWSTATRRSPRSAASSRATRGGTRSRTRGCGPLLQQHKPLVLPPHPCTTFIFAMAWQC